jgi:hypothetical protein
MRFRWETLNRALKKENGRKETGGFRPKRARKADRTFALRDGMELQRPNGPRRLPDRRLGSGRVGPRNAQRSPRSCATASTRRVSLLHLAGPDPPPKEDHDSAFLCGAWPQTVVSRWRRCNRPSEQKSACQPADGQTEFGIEVPSMDDRQPSARLRCRVIANRRPPVTLNVHWINDPKSGSWL